MRCKPGDLAHITVPGEYYGCLVSVIEAVPTTSFRLPDGQLHKPSPPGSWVIESLGKLFAAQVTANGADTPRQARYGVARDHQLRPIRPGDIDDEEVRDLYAPKQTEAA